MGARPRQGILPPDVRRPRADHRSIDAVGHLSPDQAASCDDQIATPAKAPARVQTRQKVAAAGNIKQAESIRPHTMSPTCRAAARPESFASGSEVKFACCR